MTSLCARCSRTLQIRVNLSSAEISKIENDLHSEFGPFVIPPERAEEVKQMVALADKDIEDHDSEIAHLHNQIMIIEEQKQRLKAQRAKLCSLLSGPMRKLPNEILFRIFQACETNRLFYAPPRFSAITYEYFPAMAVSSVCSRWRQLALSSPSLWANLAVSCYGESDELSSMVALYLERSGEWPLRLSFNFDHEEEDPDSDEEYPCLDLLLPHVHRWESFTYRVHQPLSFSNMPSQLHFPSLLELDVRRFSDKESSALDLFEHAPRLCALATNGAPPLKAPFNQLESLHYLINMRLSSPTELADVLNSCSSLKSLSLALKRLDQEVWEPMEQGTWHNITSLAISIREHFPRFGSFAGSCTEMVLSSLRFPSLKELVVEGDIHPADTIISFITNSSCMITTFTLHGLSISDSELITLLQVMPSILHLEINDRAGYYWQSPITSHFMQSLQHRSTSVSLAPKLQSLHLISEHEESFDDAAFISMVESRWIKPGSDLDAAMFSVGKTCIRSVVLKISWREVDAEVYQPLRNLDAEGLRVVVAGTNGVQV